AVGAENDGIDLCRIDHQDDDDAAIARDCGRTRAADRAAGHGGCLRLGANVARTHGPAGARQALHDTETHRPGADHTDSGFHDAGLGATYGTQPSRLLGTPLSISTKSMPLPRSSRLALL